MSKSKEYSPPPGCLRHFCAAHRATRDNSLCVYCGFDAEEAERRKTLIRTRGLTKGPDGLRRLVL